ncbi:putative disease resistance RPP13-like protein 1 isoform X2 [Sorghum bicolor]|uniref:Uncharacterized protein n=1 Tax=Sorghum bicolor TaxID=4558 RepID=A0A1Z5R0F0_SORBI|nr:putative disease resistance RPP13-like protein 1 isoform X2 [Sorghum bicolor]OQU77258.1 hypothetical protein SORBI_3009G018300 [Sorghum bicolor]|eukprot:XP_002440484.1 putative disease resistance RPP13-like protein 1 isoform X2 [Sorghum bicolor]
MAEVAILAVAGWFLAPTIKELMDWARSELGERYRFRKDFEDNREKVFRALQAMRSNVDDMKKYSITDPHVWFSLWELLDAIQDAAEEFMDKFQYELVEFKGRKNRFEGSAKKLKQLLGSAEDAKKNSEGLLKSLRGKQQHNPRPGIVPTTSAKTTKELFGYRQELDNLVSKLTTPSEGGTRVVGIIGHGGIGKTELARWAFHHPDTRTKFGELRIWVCVSGMVKQDDLLNQIFKSTCRGDPPPPSASLEEMIAKKIEDARRPYLLVLDDVCNDETSDELQRKTTWESVLAPFKLQEGANNNGSRILLTSRAQICLDTLGRCMDARSQRRIKIALNGINDTAQLKLLLMEEARKQTESEVVSQELEEHLEKDVGKLHGSPLAARKFVSLSAPGKNPVKSTSKKERSLLKNITIERRIEEVLVKDHLSSFEVLPSHLQRCFAFCSIFPKGWRFEVEKLTRMWTALGFVEAPPRKGGRTVDHVAKEYFDALVERSLFQQVVGTSYYEMHEHIHSMIRMVCPSYYHRIDRRSSDTTVPATVGHLSVTTECLGQLQAAVGLRKLRTLLVFDKDDEDGADAATSSSASSSSISTDEILNKLIPQEKKDRENKFKGVRVLDLSNTTRITAVPSGIGELEHLRYLGLPSTIGCLGNDVTKLLPLQTLSVIFSSDDVRLPEDMRRLINLRHLDMGKEKYIAQIAGIGSIKMLQDSVEFHARRMEQGHDMRELEGLNSLRRKLTIKCLDKVESRNEAESAGLRAKVHLKTLELKWGRRSDGAARGSAQSDLEVLEGLRPHANLEDLKVQNYVGTKSPSWLVSLEKLRCLQLINCRLDRLSLGAFPSLRTMVLTDMAELVAWEGVTGDGDGSGSAMVLFPNLRKVEIVRCPNLRSLDGLLCCRLLNHLHVEGCPVVKGEFRRSKFRPDLRLNDNTPDWPHELSFVKDEEPPPSRAGGQMRDRLAGQPLTPLTAGGQMRDRPLQPPTPPHREGGQMRDRQGQADGLPSPSRRQRNGVDTPPWVLLIIIALIMWYYSNLLVLLIIIVVWHGTNR